MKIKARTQKKVLSLVLCLAVMLSVMVVGAGAAFSDQDKIENTEAVDACSALNIINGYEDGAFHPERNIKRAEVTKMICVALNGGTEPNTSTNAVPTFNDVRGTVYAWAEGYIESCVAQGIVDGVGGPRFAPAGNVTGAQLAKMLLVALGYNAQTEKFVGNAWETNVNVRASQKHLYDGLEKMDTSAAVTRDQAAQMVWNAMQAYEVEYKDGVVQDKVVGNTRDKISLLTDKYSCSVYKGVLRASGSVAPYGVTAGKDKLNVYAEYINGVLQLNDDGNATPVSSTLKYAKDCTDMIGEYVKVLYNTKDKVVYGVYVNEEETSVVVETNRGDVGVIKAGDVDVKINDVTYDFNAAVGTSTGPRVYVADINTGWAVAAADMNAATAFGHDNRNSDYVKMVDNNGDDKIDVVFIIEAVDANVNYNGTDTMTLYADDATLGSIKKSTMNLADETYAVDDKVIVTPKAASYNGNYGVAKAEVVEGKVDAIRTATVSGVPDTTTAVQVNGKWYTLVAASSNADLAVAGSVIKDDDGNALALDGTYKLYVRGDYVYAADVVTAAGAAIGVITGTTNTKDFDGNTLLRLMKTDGTSVEAYMDWANAYSITDFKEGYAVAYTVSDNIYTLYPLSNTSSDDNLDDLRALAGYDKSTGIAITDKATAPGITGDAFTPSAGNTPAKINNKRINDGAVVFVQYDSNTGKAGMQSAWKVMSGKDVNDWKTSYGVNGGGLYKTSGLGYLDVAFLTANANAALPGSSSQYAYVTSEIGKSGDYVKYSIFDGTSDKSVEVTEKVSSTKATKGAVISFDRDGEGVIKNVSVISTAVTSDSGVAALTYTNGTQVKLNGKGYDLADDVVILNVKTVDEVGVPGKAILKAQQTSVANQYYENAIYKLNSDGEVSVLVIDVDGKWKGANTFVDTAMTAAELNALFTDSADNIGYTGDLEIVNSNDLNNLKAGDTLTINGNLTLKADLAVNGNLVVNGQLILNGKNLTGSGTVNGQTIVLGSSISGSLRLTFANAIVKNNCTIGGTANLKITGPVTNDNADATVTVNGATLEVAGSTTTNLTVKSGTVRVGDVIGNVANEGGTVTAGTITGEVSGTIDGKLTVEQILKASVAKKWDDNYQYTVTPAIAGNVVTYSGTHAQFEKKVQGVGNQIFATSADMARLLGGVYHTYNKATIVFDRTEYVWNAESTLKGSKWVDSATKKNTLVSALAAKIKADFRNDDTVKAEKIDKTYSITINGEEVSLKFVKAAQQ